MEPMVTGIKFEWPKNSRRLVIARQGNSVAIMIEQPGDIPGLWRRFWYWALLGWTWERIKQDEDGGK
jgi:hypothetical protein